MNSKTITGVKVGAARPTQETSTPPEDNPDTPLDETTFSIDVEYATVYNAVLGVDYFYLINTLTMPKPADYSRFTVMLYTQIITSGDDPISHAQITPTCETESASGAFYGEASMDSFLWMINQYAYTESEGEYPLYDATGTWNEQLRSDKIQVSDSQMLWGWDATESHQSITTTELTADSSTVEATSETTYSFQVATYRLFKNDLSKL